MAGSDPFSVEIDVRRCKGCEVCVTSCPKGALRMNHVRNELGYCCAEFISGAGCIGCGICYFVCPELGTITVCEETAGGDS